MRPGYLLIIAAAVLWGTTGTAQALAPAEAQPLAVGALRLGLGGLALVLYQLAAGRGALRGFTRQDLPALLLAAGCMAAYQVLFFAGVRLAGVAVGTMVGIGSSPVLAGLLGWLVRGERPGRRWAAATALAVAGCALLAMSGGSAGDAAGSPAAPLGLLLAVGAGAAYATFSLAGQTVLRRRPVGAVMAVIFGLGALLLAPLLFTQNLSWLAQPRGWGAVLHLGLLATAAAYLLFGFGLRRTPLAAAVTLSLAEPLTAGLLGVLVLGERLNPLSALGIALILAGLGVLAVKG